MQSQQLKDFKEKTSKDPPRDSNGKELKKIPAPKVEKIRLRCHCSQMKAMIPNSDHQSTCSIKCINQHTGLRYGINDCEQCNCHCSKTFYMQDFTQVVAKLDELELEKKKIQNVRSGGQPVGGGAGL